MKPFLPYGKHEIDEDDIAAVVSVLRGDWLTTGPFVDAFENNLCETLNVEHTVTCSSASAGLNMVAKALSLGHGTATVVPSITFLASASAPYLNGTEIVFADVDPKTGLMTSQTFLEAIKGHDGNPIKAVVLVHLAGHVCDMRGIKSVADEHDILVIEDACHALGAKYCDNEGNQHNVGACAHSDVSVFSFHPVKVIAAGEGGAVSTNNPAYAEKLKLARNHGIKRQSKSWLNKEIGFDLEGKANPWYYEMHEPALNYRMSDINASLANSQLSKLSTFVARRAELAGVYDELLEEFTPTILPPRRLRGVESAWHLYPVRIDFSALPINRRTLMDRLRLSGVGSQVHYIPVPWQPYWKKLGFKKNNFPGAAKYYEKTLSLPLFPSMDNSDSIRVIEALRAAMEFC